MWDIIMFAFTGMDPFRTGFTESFQFYSLSSFMSLLKSLDEAHSSLCRTSCFPRTTLYSKSSSFCSVAWRHACLVSCRVLLQSAMSCSGSPVTVLLKSEECAVMSGISRISSMSSGSPIIDATMFSELLSDFLWGSLRTLLIWMSRISASSDFDKSSCADLPFVPILMWSYATCIGAFWCSFYIQRNILLFVLQRRSNSSGVQSIWTIYLIPKYCDISLLYLFGLVLGSMNFRVLRIPWVADASLHALITSSVTRKLDKPSSEGV